MARLYKIGRIAAVLVCLAVVFVPMVSAAGPGQGQNPGSTQQNNNQGQGGMGQGAGPAQGGNMNPGQGSGQGDSQGPGSGQNQNQGTDQQWGNGSVVKGPPDGSFGNLTGNMTRPDGRGDGNFTAFGNMTPPNGSGYGNMTEFRNMTRFGPGNQTGLNVTFCPPGYSGNETDAANWSGVNLTGCIPMEGNWSSMDGNRSHSQFFGGDNTANGLNGANSQNPQAGGQSGQPQSQSANADGSQDQKDSDLIAAFLKWLNSGGNS